MYLHEMEKPSRVLFEKLKLFHSFIGNQQVNFHRNPIKDYLLDIVLEKEAVNEPKTRKAKLLPIVPNKSHQT